MKAITQVTAHVIEDMEKEEHIYTAGEVANLYKHFGNQSGIFSENWK